MDKKKTGLGKMPQLLPKGDLRIGSPTWEERSSLGGRHRVLKCQGKGLSFRQGAAERSSGRHAALLVL